MISYSDARLNLIKTCDLNWDISHFYATMTALFNVSLSLIICPVVVLFRLWMINSMFPPRLSMLL